MASSRLPMPRSAFRNKARDSMYPVNPPARDAVRTEPTAPTLNPFLADCLKAFEACNKSLMHAEAALADGIYDMPRIAKVLDNKLLYQVVGESTVRAYKSELADEMEAQTYELMERAREGLKQVQKEENDLRFGIESSESRPPSRATATAATGTKLEQRRIQLLAKQNERLDQELAAWEAKVDALEMAAMGR